jgi:hypothetical protein
MEDDVAASGGASEGALVEDAALDDFQLISQFPLSFQVFPAPGGEVVEDADVVAALKQRPGERGANEPRPAGDEDCTSHGLFYPPAALDGRVVPCAAPGCCTR